jgi:hypothetical protein
VKTWRGAAMMVQKPRSKEEGVKGWDNVHKVSQKHFNRIENVTGCLLRREGLSSVKQVAVLQTVGCKPRGVAVYTKVMGAGVVEFSVTT